MTKKTTLELSDDQIDMIKTGLKVLIKRIDHSVKHFDVDQVKVLIDMIEQKEKDGTLDDQPVEKLKTIKKMNTGATLESVLTELSGNSVLPTNKPVKKSVKPYDEQTQQRARHLIANSRYATMFDEICPKQPKPQYVEPCRTLLLKAFGEDLDLKRDVINRHTSEDLLIFAVYYGNRTQLIYMHPNADQKLVFEKSIRTAPHDRTDFAARAYDIPLNMPIRYDK